MLVALERPRGAILPRLKVGRKIPFLVPPTSMEGPQQGSSITSSSQPKVSCNPIIPMVIFGILHSLHAYFQSQILPQFSLKSQIPPFKKGKSRIPKNRLGTLSMVICLFNVCLHLFFKLPMVDHRSKNFDKDRFQKGALIQHLKV